jgi:hypothetical protein
MAKFMNFFPRQMVMGNPAGSGSGTFYSDIYDASDVKAIRYELRSYAASSGATCVATLEQNDKAELLTADWSTYIAPSLTGVDLVAADESATPKRFLRVKLTVKEGAFLMIHFNVRGFC